MNYTLDKLVELVVKWRADRGLDGQDPSGAFMKLAEEFGEIADAMNRQDKTLLEDAIGDTLVCLIGLAQTNGIDITRALGLAYGEIRDRKGMLKGGMFVKYEDLSPLEKQVLDARIEDNESR